ncbi:hypothetical protein [Micromonospora sp. NPDC049891]|uniref:hypothetical protein n=1 Tax=Micromonospora sp. NPDC049891 TaxID=3155655 RepID=UPI0033F43E67
MITFSLGPSKVAECDLDGCRLSSLGLALTGSSLSGGEGVEPPGFDEALVLGRDGGGGRSRNRSQSKTRAQCAFIDHRSAGELL